MGSVSSLPWWHHCPRKDLSRIVRKFLEMKNNFLTRFTISEMFPNVPQTCQPWAHKSAGFTQERPQVPTSSPHLGCADEGESLRFLRPHHQPLQPATVGLVKNPSRPPSEQPVVRALAPYLSDWSSANWHLPWNWMSSMAMSPGRREKRAILVR